jgi:hypothetical protein
MKCLVSVGCLIGMLAIAGCDPPPSPDISGLEHPPLKPPNCPALPELTNLTLKDGSIADVRIIQFKDTKIYVPAELLENDFIPEDYKNVNMHGIMQQSQIGPVQPYLSSVECPGVVHIHSGLKYGRSSGFGISFRDIDGSLTSKPADAYSLIEPIDGFWIHGITIWPKLEKPEGFWKYTSAPKPHVILKYNADIDIDFQWRSERFPFPSPIDNPWKVANDPIANVEWQRNAVKSESWRESKKVVFDLVDWLSTPPSKRQNDRKFSTQKEAEKLNYERSNPTLIMPPNPAP